MRTLRSVSAFAVLGLGTLGCMGLELDPSALDPEPVAVPADRIALVGDWRGDETTLHITQQGKVSWSYEGDHSNANLEGAQISAWRDDGFVAGFGPLQRTFRITDGPRQAADGTWTLDLDGVRLTRRSEADPPDPSGAKIHVGGSLQL